MSLARAWESTRSLTIPGFYADYVHDFETARHRISAGAELGRNFFGVDLGPVIEWGGANAQGGIRGRLYASAAVVAVYAGPVLRFGNTPERAFLECGVLLKLPLPLDKAPPAGRGQPVGAP